MKEIVPAIRVSTRDPKSRLYQLLYAKSLLPALAPPPQSKKAHLK